MKKGIFFLLITFVAAISADAQTLKELLYSGKLKKDSSVIRSTDDLQSKIDTSTKKDPVPADVVAVKAADSLALDDSTAVTDLETNENIAADKETVKQPAAPAKSAARIWKEHTDQLAEELKADVLSSKKIKKGTYYFTVDYEIDTTGQVTVVNVSVTPENTLLLGNVQQRLFGNAPQLAPVTDGSGKARKVKRKHNFSITKD